MSFPSPITLSREEQENMNNKNLLLKNKCQIYDYFSLVHRTECDGNLCECARVGCGGLNLTLSAFLIFMIVTRNFSLLSLLLENEKNLYIALLMSLLRNERTERKKFFFMNDEVVEKFFCCCCLWSCNKSKSILVQRLNR
jgi:hypothetical protein